MTPLMLSAAKAVCKKDRSFSVFCASAMKIVVSGKLWELAASRAERQSANAEKPVTSNLPARNVIVQIVDAVHACTQMQDGSVFVYKAQPGGLVFLYGYKPKFAGEVYPNGYKNELSRSLIVPSFASHGSESASHYVAAVFSVLNTPGMTIECREKGNVLHCAKVRKLTGKAATAWTNVDLVPGLLVERGEAERSGTSQPKALHHRKAHYAWVPSQRKTPKGVWLDAELAGPRGPGWYALRIETTAGSAKVGPTAQRHLAHKSDEGRPQFGTFNTTESKHDREFRLKMLSESQRALMVRAGAILSGTIH